jgi:2-polyprenyl-3-methyl-5-hydroxy-6-metoxy-1,4-benzoquinol methylase
MIAKRELPEAFKAWNRRQGAPVGKRREKRELLQKLVSKETFLRWKGPFSLQTNNTIRQFEYPWAWYATDLKPGMKVLEIGGGLSGFQFALSAAGLDVVNVDPGMSELGWSYEGFHFDELNRLFETNVRFVSKRIEEASLGEGSMDRIFCLSVLEHLDQASAVSILRHCGKLLAPGGRIVITLDLFLNLAPFTRRSENQYGRNLNVRALIEESGLELSQGTKAELYGFPEFTSEGILASLEDYFVGTYPALSQCIVLQR